MSKYVELMQQAEKQRERIRTHGRPIAPACGRLPKLDLEALTREEIAKLVQRLFLSPDPNRPRTVVFSGLEHGSGCSWICARASESLVVQGADSVCLVDTNLRSPSLHEYFAVDNIVGLAEAVLQTGSIRNFVQRIPGSNLWLLTCGFHTLDPHSLLSSDRLRSRILELRSEFDHVLIDTPPIGHYADATLLGQLADGVVLVVEANSTRRETTRRAKENLEAASVRLLGAVLNKRTFPIPEFLYRRL
jgi:capsular exopolysaccharide synthesis family protein